MPSAISAASPWPLGGGSNTRASWKSTPTGSTKLRRVFGQILERQRRPRGPRGLGHALAERPAVERRATGLCDQLERVAQLVQPEDVARGRRATVRQEGARPLGELGKARRRARP